MGRNANIQKLWRPDLFDLNVDGTLGFSATFEIPD
jgi:hypothetical protein